MTTLPEAKLDTLLTRHAMVEAELSRQIPPEQFVKLRSILHYVGLPIDGRSVSTELVKKEQSA